MLDNELIISWKLTCPLKINGWKMYSLLKWSLFRGHVSFRGCNLMLFQTSFSLAVEVSTASALPSAAVTWGYPFWMPDAIIGKGWEARWDSVREPLTTAGWYVSGTHKHVGKRARQENTTSVCTRWEAKGACLSKLAGKKLRIHSEKGSPIKNQIGLCNSFLSNKIQGDVPTRSHCSCIPSSGLT